MKTENKIWHNCLILFLCVFSFNCFAQNHFEYRIGKYALKSGDSLISNFIFTEVSFFSENRCWVNKGDLYGYINQSGDSITPFVYTDVTEYHNGFAAVSLDTMDSKYGFVDRDGKLICKLIYSRVQSFSFGLAPVQLDSVWGLIDTSGNLIVDPQYDYPPIIISNSFIIVSKEAKWGIVNQSNEVVYPLIFDLITKDGIGYMKNDKYYLGLK